MLTPILILLATIAYAAGTLLIARASLYIDSNLAGTIVNILAGLIPMTVFFLIGVSQVSSPEKSRGILLAVLAGVAIAIFTISLTKVFSLGGNLSYVTPVVYGGAILITSMVGWAAFKESISLLQAAGIGMILAGILLVALARAKVAV